MDSDGESAVCCMEPTELRRHYHDDQEQVEHIRCLFMNLFDPSAEGFSSALDYAGLVCAAVKGR